MKLKLTMLTAFCLLLFSCPSSDDDNNIQTAVLTETNYAYEGDLYRFALNTEIDTLNGQIEFWQSLQEGDEGFEEAQENIAIAENRLGEVYEILENLLESVELGFPPIPAPPPPPVPCLCFDLFKDIDYIVTDTNLLGFVATLTNENQEEVFSTDLSNPLNTEGLEGEFSAYNFVSLQDEFTGNGFLTITKVIDEENIINYTIPVTVNELP